MSLKIAISDIKRQQNFRQRTQRALKIPVLFITYPANVTDFQQQILYFRAKRKFFDRLKIGQGRIAPAPLLRRHWWCNDDDNGGRPRHRRLAALQARRPWCQRLPETRWSSWWPYVATPRARHSELPVSCRTASAQGWPPRPVVQL